MRNYYGDTVENSDIKLSLSIPYQSTIGLITSTLIEKSQVQTEIRRGLSNFPLRKFSLETRLLSCQDVQYLIRFFENRRGRLLPFRFNDISNHRVTAKPLLSYYNNLSGEYQYTRGVLIPLFIGSSQGRVNQAIGTRDANGTDHLILKPLYKINSLTAYNSYDPSSIIQPISVDHSTGVVTMPQVINGNYLADCEFDTVVRFDTDELDFELVSTNEDLENISTAYNLPGTLTNGVFPQVAPLGLLLESTVKNMRVPSLEMIEIIPDFRKKIGVETLSLTSSAPQIPAQ